MASELEPTTPEFISEMNLIEKVGIMKMKGYSYAEIGDEMAISSAKAKTLTGKYKELIRYQAQNDPDFMDRVQENTLEYLQSFDELLKEAWETVTIATDNAMVGARINALKLASEILTKKGTMLQLMGGKTDSSYMARMSRAEAVNTLLASIIKDIVSQCEVCSPEARDRLAEAFSLMGDAESAVDAQPYMEGEVVDDYQEG